MIFRLIQILLCPLWLVLWFIPLGFLFVALFVTALPVFYVLKGDAGVDTFYDLLEKYLNFIFFPLEYIQELPMKNPVPKNKNPVNINPTR